MKKIIELIKAFFQIKKLFKKGIDMNLESIRKIWALIGGIILAINVSWLPAWVSNLFGPEGTEVVFKAIGAILALIQFLPFRTGENNPQALKAGDKAKFTYWLPWVKA